MSFASSAASSRILREKREMSEGKKKKKGVRGTAVEIDLERRGAGVAERERSLC